LCTVQATGRHAVSGVMWERAPAAVAERARARRRERGWGPASSEESRCRQYNERKRPT